MVSVGADEEADLQQLAVAVFRGLLRLLPASARTWFSSLRDRSTATLVEVGVLCHMISFDACICMGCMPASRQS